MRTFDHRLDCGASRFEKTFAIVIAEPTRQNATIQEDVTMYQSARSLQEASFARQSEMLNLVTTYRFLSPEALAARDRLTTHRAHHAVERRDPDRVVPRPVIVRRWLGDRLVRLGARLGGVGVPAREATVGG